MAAPLIAAGSAALGFLGGALNRRSQEKTNQRSERFQSIMYNRQRADALSDWNMQNAYNDPSAQMQRLKNAGLNPNLVYGSGAVANNSSAPRSSSVGSPSYRAPSYDFNSLVNQAMQTRQLQSNIARTDAETAAIMARTTEQNYRNMAFTPELFAKELETKIEAQSSGAYSSRMSGDVANARADIAALERENLALISGKSDRFNRHQTFDNKGSKVNMVYDKFEADVQNIISRTQNTMTGTANLSLTGELLKYEVDLMKALGVDKGTANALLQNFMKIFLLQYNKR